jgi:hypothetical protein
MKNQIIKTTAILGLLLVFAVAGAQAQTATRQVNIPFDFAAGQTKLKAGDYVISERSTKILAISNSAGEVVALVNAPLTIGARDSKGGARLVFNQYEDRFFLSQVWLRSETGKQLFTTSGETRTAREYKLAKHGGKPKRIEIAVVR